VQLASGLTSLVLTDGKAGDEQQCLGIAEALGVSPELRRVRPRRPFGWVMPWGPIDPRERPSAPDSPIAPPYPDLVIASGRRAVPYLRHVKRGSGGRSFTVFLKDPRTGPASADLIWVPEHDRLRGPNVIVTVTPPHRVSPQRLAAARANPDPRLGAARQPRVAILAGGHSRHHRFTEEDLARFVAGLTSLAEDGAGLMFTASRRTPPGLKAALRGLAGKHDGFFWEGEGDNPYISLLALADYIVATADSFNMIGEAAASGAPILVFEPSGGHPKLRRFLASLREQRVIHNFHGRLEGVRYSPIDATAVIAERVAEALDRHRLAVGVASGPTRTKD
jgi:mitochondrial fission protein ELM1